MFLLKPLQSAQILVGNCRNIENNLHLIYNLNTLNSQLKPLKPNGVTDQQTDNLINSF